MLVWVTSFTPEIYQASGQGLVESFVASGSDGTLIVQAENTARPRPPGIAYSDAVKWMTGLAADSLLTGFLADNCDVIPTDLGGRWVGPCKCVDQDPHAKTHTMPCPGAWFCRHASRWFRKLVALDRTYTQLGDLTDDVRVVWVDADVTFVNKVTVDRVDRWLDGRQMFYLKGPLRETWECGVFGLRGTAGFRYLSAVIARYATGVFRRDDRWDDSYQFQKTLVERPDLITAVDLATGASERADVVPHSPLRDYLTHDKGKHSRVLKLFT